MLLGLSSTVQRLSMEAKNGTTTWLELFGSSNDDRLAGAGGSLIVDVNKNCVIFGDTTGSFPRTRAGDPNPNFDDLFVVQMRFSDGVYLQPVNVSDSSSQADAESESSIDTDSDGDGDGDSIDETQSTDEGDSTVGTQIGNETNGGAAQNGASGVVSRF